MFVECFVFTEQNIYLFILLLGTVVAMLVW